MAVERPYGFESDLVRHPISGSAAWFFIIILKFIFTPIFEIKIHAKKLLDNEKISFSKFDFHIDGEVPPAWELKIDKIWKSLAPKKIIKP